LFTNLFFWCFIGSSITFDITTSLGHQGECFASIVVLNNAIFLGDLNNPVLVNFFANNFNFLQESPEQGETPRAKEICPNGKRRKRKTGNRALVGVRRRRQEGRKFRQRHKTRKLSLELSLF